MRTHVVKKGTLTPTLKGLRHRTSVDVHCESDAEFWPMHTWVRLAAAAA